jgi:hypothetical protein
MKPIAAWPASEAAAVKPAGVPGILNLPSGARRPPNSRPFGGFLQTDHGNRGRQVFDGLQEHTTSSGFGLQVHDHLDARAWTLLWTWNIENFIAAGN